ncbi:MAG: metal-binding protein [Pyrinomonadaceae bacterium]|nr:metal-binding protein [Pyrinomonadaceae bacterium]
MPSGKTHDSITFLLTVPVIILFWKITGSVALSALAGSSFLFGGLMFGPDLDTRSVQYHRWGWFKALWYPYRFFFPHRSFWTHGLIFGTLIRLIYFLGVFTLLAVGGFSIATLLIYGSQPEGISYVDTWSKAGQYLRGLFGEWFMYVVFGGLWVGAASHSLADWALSYIKTGKP